MERCAVLLATYNGEKYIKEQFLSIINQEKVDITVYISDDNSTDKTIQILKSFKYEKLVFLDSIERMGSASKNFFRLIRDVDFSSYDFIAFADQDDIWYKDKLFRAILSIKDKNIDGYSSNVMAFWDDGRKKLVKKDDLQKEYDFLFASPGPGCTHVFTQEFMVDFKKALLTNNDLSKNIELHDWIVYAYARANGYKWWIDSSPSMEYRQHANNVFGANSGYKTLVKRWNEARNGWYANQIVLIAKFCNLSEIKPIKYLKSNKYLDKVKLALMVFKLRRKKSEALMLALMLIIPGFKV